MSERAPTQTPKDERDELAKLEDQLSKKRQEVASLEAFGKYDVTAPNEGEDTYQSYMEKRPGEGVVRDGEGYRQAHTGQFASEETYAAQNGSTQEYYDKLGGIENQAPFEAPDYDKMGLMELAKAASAARELGDRAALDQIHAAAEHHVMEQATHPGSEWTDEQYQAEMARFDGLIDRFAAKADGTQAETGQTTADAGGEVDPTDTPEADAELANDEASATPESADVVPGADGAEVAAEEGESLEEYEQRNSAETSASHRNERAMLGDEEVVVTGVFTDPEIGEVIYRVAHADADQAPTLHSAEELAFAESVAADAETAEQETDADAETEAEADEDAEQESVIEKVRAWWGANKESIKEKFTLEYWGAKWTNFNDRLVNRGVTEEMTEEEQQEKREKNRRNLMIGAAGLAGLTVGVAAGFGIAQLFDNGGDTSALADAAPRGFEGTGTDNVSGDEEGGLDALPLSPDGEVPPETEAPVAPEITPDPNFNIPEGGGGEALFNRLGIDPSKWYANQEALLAQFPNEFYRMDGGNVGILRPGPLSQGAQDFINSLR